MNNQNKLKSTIGIILFALTFLFPIAASASAIHETTAVAATGGPTLSDAHYEKSAWLYTKRDSTGYAQIYYQYLDNSTSPATLSEIALTTSRFHKRMPKWGGQPSSLYYYSTYGATTSRQCEGMQLYYFLGDSDKDGDTEIHVSCINDYLTGSPTTLFTVKLTEWDTDSTYDVVDYDVSREPSTYLETSIVSRTNSYPVVFTTEDGGIHLLQHQKSIIYGDDSNVTYDAIVHDNDDPSSLFKWGATNRASASQFSTYKEPRFDERGYNITFLGVPTSSTDGLYQVGLLWATGTKEYQVTNFSRTIANARFHGSIQDTSATAAVDDLFFEFEEDSSTKGQLVHMKISVNVFGPSNWCDTVFIMTDDTSTRHHMATKLMDSGTSSGNTQINFALTQPDGKNDIYIANVMLAQCDGKMITSPSSMTKSSSLTFAYTETQLTCMNDNTDVKILPDRYYDATFTRSSYSTIGFTDVVFLRDFSDGSGTLLAHIYDVENATSECADTCYENSDGSVLDDDNTYLDGDGIKDECEDNLPCSATFITADPTGDYDSDTIINSEDNCACSYNPTQSDSDADGVGDVYGTENGCDNCPGVANPADMDNNGDGLTGETTYSDGYLDGDVRQTDTDSDGYGDACEEVDEEEDECGTNDRDADGINDYCDNCLYTYNPSQDDEDGNGAGDACTTVTEVVITYPCEEGNTDYLYDRDGDGTNESCTSSPSYPCEEGNENYLYDTDDDGTKDSCDEPETTYPCEEGNQNYLYDTDTDGTKDSCFPCAGDSDYNYDANGDGVNETCALLQVAEEEPTISGGYMLHGSICSLGLGAAAAGVPAAFLIVLGLMPIAVWRRVKAKN